MSKALPPTVLRKMAVADLTPADYNPRAISQPALDGLTRSIEHFGVVQPIVWNVNSNRVVSGHQRLKALERLGIEETEVLVVDLDEADEKALNILQNSGAISGFFTDDLAPLLAEIKEHFPAEFYEELRFDEIRIGDPLAVPDFGTGFAGNGDPDAVPETPAEPTTKPGDLWILGKHRLLCGDATSADDVGRLLGSAAPRIMVTDPPYGVDYDPAWRDEAADKGLISYAASRVGEVANDDRSDWREAYSLFPGAVLYSWSPAGSMSFNFHEAILASGFEIRMQIIWSKPHIPISRGHYHVRHEPCWYAVRKGKDAGWIGDRSQNTVWETPLDKNVEGGHSTQKPVELMEHPLRNHSGDVYDPFVGTGTTIIAAERTGRTCYAMDIEPRWCDVAVRRWETYTGETAVLSGTP